MRAHPLRAAGLALVFLALAACGVGNTDGGPRAFEIKAIGAAGGSIAAGDVALDIPPGALTEDTVVSILPQRDPFPIQPAPGDPCLYDYLGPIWCVGPVGTDLLVAGVIRVSYDESLIPPGVSEDDLVLMLWDDALGVLVPQLAGVIHDTAANVFEFPAYLELGHVAVGIRTCLQPPVDFAFVGRAALVVVDQALGAASSPGLYVHSVDDDTEPPLLLDTGLVDGQVALPDRFIPSRDGARIAWWQGSGDTESKPGGGGTAGTLGDGFGLGLCVNDVTGGVPNHVLEDRGDASGNDRLTGWWGGSGGSSDLFFNRFDFQDETALVDGTRDEILLALIDAATATPNTDTDFHAIPNFAFFIDDLRQSPTDEHILVRYVFFAQQSFEEALEIVDATTGAVVGADLPVGDGELTPRFTPDGLEVYRIDNEDGGRVLATDLTGGNERTLYSANSTIRDFVIHPDGVQWLALQENFFNDGQDLDVLVYGVFDQQGAQVIDTEPIDGSIFFSEFIWNPVADVAYLSVGGNLGVVPISVDPNATAGSEITVHPGIDTGFSGIGYVDASTVDGRLLVTVRSFVVGIDGAGLVAAPGDGATAMFDVAGVWVSDPDGSNARQVETPADLTIDLPARWLEGWRATPTFFDRVR